MSSSAPSSSAQSEQVTPSKALEALLKYINVSNKRGCWEIQESAELFVCLKVLSDAKVLERMQDQEKKGTERKE